MSEPSGHLVSKFILIFYFLVDLWVFWRTTMYLYSVWIGEKLINIPKLIHKVCKKRIWNRAIYTHSHARLSLFSSDMTAVQCIPVTSVMWVIHATSTTSSTNCIIQQGSVKPYRFYKWTVHPGNISFPGVYIPVLRQVHLMILSLLCLQTWQVYVLLHDYVSLHWEIPYIVFCLVTLRNTMHI